MVEGSPPISFVSRPRRVFVVVAYWMVQLIPCLDGTSILDWNCHSFLSGIDFLCS